MNVNNKYADSMPAADRYIFQNKLKKILRYEENEDYLMKTEIKYLAK